MDPHPCGYYWRIPTLTSHRWRLVFPFRVALFGRPLTDARLDVYVYNNITSSKPEQIFKLQGLVKGDAKISGYNTIMTAEVDRNSSLNAGKPLSAMTPDLLMPLSQCAVYSAMKRGNEKPL